jgi:hypothetical protein
MAFEYASNGIKTKVTTPELQEISITNDVKNWSIVMFDFKSLGKNAVDKNLKLVFEARCGNDIFGRPAVPACQVRVGCRNKAKTILKNQRYTRFSFDQNTEAWKRIEIPLFRQGSDESEFAEISRVYFQYINKPRAGFAIRNLHFEK